MRLSLLFAPLAAVALWACSSDPVGTDAGTNTPDADQRYDSGVLDLGVSDVGPRPDSGPRDAGFRDPEVTRAGVERIQVQSAVNPTRTTTLGTYLEIYAKTSTLPPLFIAARGPGTAHEYLPPHLEFLQPNRTVVYYDIRGAGRSSYGDGTGSSTITVEQHVNDLAGLVDYVGALPDGIDTSRIDLLGHGYGGLLAMRYASTHPARVRKLVLVSPYPLTILESVDLRAEIETRIGSVDRQRLFQIINRPECYGNDVQCFLEAWNIVGRYYLCPANREAHWGELTFTTGSFRNEYLFIAQDLRARSYDDRPFLANVTATTTVISGPCEPTPARTALGYATIRGAQHLLLPNTGEFAMVEDAAGFRNAVLHALFR